MQTLEDRAGLKTSVSRYSHSSAGAAGGTGRTAGIAGGQVRLYYPPRGGEVKESLIARTVANSRKRMYTAHETQQDPMKRLLFLALTAVTLLMGTSASACEKHLNGHQNGSDTDLEGSKK